jgi:hypothetical protein
MSALGPRPGLPAIFATLPLLLRKRTCTRLRHRSQTCQEQSATEGESHRPELRYSFISTLSEDGHDRAARKLKKAVEREETFSWPTPEWP